MSLILIKSFNRPWCLDRCLSSVFNISNNSRVIVVDDGTELQYINKLKKSYPKVIFITDSRNDGKVEYLRKHNNLGPVKLWNGVDPNKNWVEAAKHYHDDFIVVHEDDGYTPQVCNLNLLTTSMVNHNISYLDISGKFGRTCRVDKVLKCYDDITIYANTRPWSWFAAAFCIYRYKMFETLYSKGLNGLLQDGNILRKNAISYYQRNPNHRGAYANGSAKIIISDTLPSRNPYKGMTNTQQLNDILSKAWLKDKFPWRKYYPHMIPFDVILDILKNELTDAQLESYKQWRINRFKEYTFPYGLDGKIIWENT